MSRSRVNFTIDAAMLICGSALTGIGLLMKFVLIPGKERISIYGRPVDLFFIGLDRHEWGTLHLWLAYILIGLLISHIFLHLRWIAGMTREAMSVQRFGKAKAALFLAACLIMALFAFFVNPDIREGGGELRGYGKGRTEHRFP